MIDLLRLSTRQDDRVTLNADWVELATELYDDKSTSAEDLARAISQASGVSDQASQQHAEDVFVELSDRERACGGAYPFEVVGKGTLLRRRRPSAHRRACRDIYRFLLMVSRWDMSSGSRVQAGHDATKLFEVLCADIILSFWGGSRANVAQVGSLVAGTSARAGFKAKVSDVCGRLAEGGGWKDSAKPPGGGDAGLDIVVWRTFRDKRRGALVGFAQCKTGIHWRDDLEKMVPRTLCARFMRDPLILDPIKIYMIPCRVDAARWEDDTRRGGLLIDRCRIVEYADCVSRQTLRACNQWSVAVRNELRKQRRRLV